MGRYIRIIGPGSGREAPGRPFLYLNERGLGGPIRYCLRFLPASEERAEPDLHGDPLRPGLTRRPERLDPEAYVLRHSRCSERRTRVGSRRKRPPNDVRSDPGIGFDHPSEVRGRPGGPERSGGSERSRFGPIRAAPGPRSLQRYVYVLGVNSGAQALPGSEDQ